jgi:hypothetical protein
MKNNQPTEQVSSKPPAHFPWWLSVLFAIGCYCLLKYAVPNLTPGNSTVQKLVQAAPAFAPLATIPFLLLAAKQLYDTDIKKEDPEQPEGDDEERPQE